MVKGIWLFLFVFFFSCALAEESSFIPKEYQIISYRDHSVKGVLSFKKKLSNSRNQWVVYYSPEAGAVHSKVRALEPRDAEIKRLENIVLKLKKTGGDVCAPQSTTYFLVTVKDMKDKKEQNYYLCSSQKEFTEISGFYFGLKSAAD